MCLNLAWTKPSKSNLAVENEPHKLMREDNVVYRVTFSCTLGCLAFMCSHFADFAWLHGCSLIFFSSPIGSCIVVLDLFVPVMCLGSALLRHHQSGWRSYTHQRHVHVLRARLLCTSRTPAIHQCGAVYVFLKPRQTHDCPPCCLPARRLALSCLLPFSPSSPRERTSTTDVRSTQEQTSYSSTL